MIKKIIDFFIGLFFILLLSPIIVGLSIFIYLKLGENPFFIQKRIGENNRIFVIYKFKTMNNKKDVKGYLLSDKERLTKVGSLLRKYSIDELPQFLNLILGNMSLIGPRPLLVEYLPLYNSSQIRRHNVKPGITGWAQVNGRNAISWTEKFEYDVWYVNNLNFYLDLKIIFLTIQKIFKSEGINQEGEATMEKFKGNN